MDLIVLIVISVAIAFIVAKYPDSWVVTVPSTLFWLAVMPGIPVLLFLALAVWLRGWMEALVWLALVIGIPLLVWRVAPQGMTRAASEAPATRPATRDGRAK